MRKTGGADDEVAPRERLRALGEELARSRRRADRLRRRMRRLQDGVDQQAASATWQEWSHSVDEALFTVNKIADVRAHDLSGLVIKYEALSWWLWHDDALLNRTARRRIRTFGRELAVVAEGLAER